MNTTDISESLEPGPLLGLGSSAVLGPEVAARTLVERLRFLASGQDDPHSVAIDEAADAQRTMPGARPSPPRCCRSTTSRRRASCGRQ